MKNINRCWSFIIVALVYCLAIALGVISYIFLPLHFWLKLLIADIISTVVVFVFSLIFHNASMYDPYWSVQPMVMALGFLFTTPQIGTTHILLVVAIMFWGIRLTANWAYTFYGLGFQDWRYTMLHEKTGKLYPVVNFVGIHLVPTLVVYGCAIPMVFAFEEGAPFNAGVAIFGMISIAAAVLQGIADIQMHKYRKNRNGTFMRNGLWKYSRHPNYLGEILMWWGIALAYVCAVPQRWYLIAGAVANTMLFLFVSIPMADKRQSRKEGFAEYKKQTRMLLPIYKKQ